MNWTLKLENLIKKLPREHKNIRTLDALEKLIENLDKIDIEKIEQLIPVCNIIEFEYNYEMLFKSEPNDNIKIDGWIPIVDNMIKHPEKINEYIKKGLLRKIK